MLLRSLRNWVALCCIAVCVTACGGGSGGGNSATNTSGSGTTNGGSTSAPTPVPLNFSVVLQWAPPSTRADGSALPSTELAGYRIYYALESDASQDTVVPVSGGLTTSAQITLGMAGTYTFAITALDQSGQESSLSTAVSVAIN